MAVDGKLHQLPGFNPDGVMGYVLQPMPDMKVFAVPDRALEVLDVVLTQVGTVPTPLMFRNSMGHRGRASYDGTGLKPIDSIECAFTAGLEHVGGPEGVFPLHGTFSQTPAHDIKDSRLGGITGKIDFDRLVVGPHITVTRTVSPCIDEYAFHITDELEARVASDYMFLYHPNFPVVNGTQFYSSERLVVPRPGIINETDMRHYITFERVGEGKAVFPPSDDGVEAIRAENFEKCYVMSMQLNVGGDVYAMLISPDGEQAAYIHYNVNSFQPSQQAFQLWKNPRDGSCGLVIGSTFLGRAYAADNNLLCHLEPGERHVYSIDIGFLFGKGEVDEMKDMIDHMGYPKIEAMDPIALANVYKGHVMDL